MILFQLFFEFFKTGLFAVGGGLATLPFIYRIADNYGWITYPVIADMIAVSESTPGPIGVNMATYTGFHTAGPLGGVIATLGLVAPSIVVIVLVAKILEQFKQSKIVQALFSGLRPAATGLIAAAGFSVLRLSLYDDKAENFLEIIRYRELILFALLFALIWKYKKHPILYIAAAAVAGIALSL